MSEGLELESRRRIYDFLVANPGTHLRRIGHALGMSTGMLSYHLGYLERNGVLKAEEDGHRKRYFIARVFVETQRRILAILRQDVPRKIVLSSCCTRTARSPNFRLRSACRSPPCRITSRSCCTASCCF